MDSQPGMPWSVYWVLLGLLCISAMFCSVLFYWLTQERMIGERSIEIDVENLRQRQLGDVESFLIVADRFAKQHEYSKEYNCVNYSETLYEIAGELGFSVERVAGCMVKNMSSCHEWLRLRVDFEPINGAFVDYSKEYMGIEVVGDGKGAWD